MYVCVSVSVCVCVFVRFRRPLHRAHLCLVRASPTSLLRTFELFPAKEARRYLYLWEIHTKPSLPEPYPEPSHIGSGSGGVLSRGCIKNPDATFGVALGSASRSVLWPKTTTRRVHHSNNHSIWFELILAMHLYGRSRHETSIYILHRVLSP